MTWTKTAESDSGAKWQCSACGIMTTWTRNPPEKIHHACGLIRHRWLLGNQVAWALAKLGFKPWKGCGCKGRQAALNRWSLGVQARAAKQVRLFVGAFRAWGRAVAAAIRPARPG